MSGCVLRVYGKNFAVTQFLKDSGFKPHIIRQRGELKTVGGKIKNKDSGFNVIVSNASGERIEKQFKDALSFLKKHNAEFERLKQFAGVEFTCLDFGINLRIGYDDSFWPALRVPTTLMQMAGNLGLDLEFSLYPDINPEYFEVKDDNSGK